MRPSPKFLSQLELRAHLPGEWVLTATLTYRSASGGFYHVPARFVTDLASIPGIARPVIDQNGLSRRPAVLHDFLYCIKHGTRSEADALFLEALQAEGVGAIARYTMWLAVRAGGWLYWNRRGGITAEDFTSA